MTAGALVRTRSGTMVHRAECHMANRGGAVPWAWAATKPRADVLQAIFSHGYRTCAYCRPLGLRREHAEMAQ